MKKLASVIAAIAILSIATFAFAGNIKGSVSKITKNANGSYTVVVKDAASGKDVVVEVADEVTVGKLNGKKIVTDDEVKVKFEEKGGKNVATKFLKAAGC